MEVSQGDEQQILPSQDLLGQTNNEAEHKEDNEQINQETPSLKLPFEVYHPIGIK